MKAFRGSLLSCTNDPGHPPDPNAIEYIEDGLIAAKGLADTVLKEVTADIEVVDYSRNLVVPGFIDCHVHYPQLGIIGS